MGKIVRAISEDGSILSCAIDTTDIVSKAEQYHETSAVTTAALGRLLTGASMMGAMLKNEGDTLSLRIDGNGPAGTVYAESDYRGNVRGYVENPVVEGLPKRTDGHLNVGGAVGSDGTLTVVRDLGLKEPYVGQIPLVSGEIAEDITSYYAVSEQIPTVCSLGVLVNPDLTVAKAGGFMIQLLPFAPDSAVDIIEENLKKLEAVTKMLTNGMTAEEIALKAIEGTNANILDEWEVDYVCDCSREYCESVIRSMNSDELLEIAKEDGGVRVECHYCDGKYEFNLEEIEKIIEDKKKSSKNS